MLKDFIKIVSQESDTQRLQDNIELFLKQIKNISILDGVLLEDVSVPTGSDVVIPHKLNRKLVGYIVVRNSAEATIWDKQSDNTLPGKTLILKSSADTTISMWVF